MTSTTTTTTRNRRTQGLIAVGAGALLLVGGSSFALWTVNSQVAGGTITAGNLDVLVASGTWQDVSPEHAAPVDIADIADFRIVPGDVLEGTFPVDVAALGDNLVADLTVGFASPSGALLAASRASPSSTRSSMRSATPSAPATPSRCSRLTARPSCRERCLSTTRLTARFPN